MIGSHRRNDQLESTLTADRKGKETHKVRYGTNSSIDLRKPHAMRKSSAPGTLTTFRTMPALLSRIDRYFDAAAGTGGERMLPVNVVRMVKVLTR